MEERRKVSLRLLAVKLTLAGELNPCAGHVVRHGLDAGADKAVLRDILQRTVSQKRRHGPELPHGKTVLEQ